MAIASITTWLNNPNKIYAHGLLLFEQYGSSAVTLALLRSGEGSYHLSKMQQALQALNDQPGLQPKAVVIGAYIAEPISIHGKGQFDYATAPEQIVQIWDNKNQHYAQARKLHEAIRVLDDQDHRLQAGLELLDHMDKVNQSWSILDKYHDTGEIAKLDIPDQAAAVDSLTVAQLIQEHNNLKPNISKDRRKLRETTDQAKKIELARRLEMREARLVLVKGRLKNEIQ